MLEDYQVMNSTNLGDLDGEMSIGMRMDAENEFWLHPLKLDEERTNWITRLDVSAGTKGILTVDERLTGLSESEARLLEGINTYEGWRFAREELVGSLYADISIRPLEKGKLLCFAGLIGSALDNNPLITTKRGLLVFCVGYPPRTERLTRTTHPSVTVLSPSMLGAKGGKWATRFKFEKGAKAEFTISVEGSIELKISETQYMVPGLWQLEPGSLPVGTRLLRHIQPTV